MLRLLAPDADALLPGLALAPPDALVDPRSGGVTLALGEWSVVPEAPAIRPGPVTFVVTNRGKARTRFGSRRSARAARDG